MVCYTTPQTSIKTIRPAEKRRAWMDATGERFAYRCLPLTIANSHGWEMLCERGFDVVWDGSPGSNGIAVTAHDGGPPPARGHFGSGIVTIGPHVIIRTPPGYNLWVGGRPNSFKDGAQALSAIIETDWMPFTFSMNWKLTRPGLRVRFEQGESFCFFFPLRRGDIEAFTPRWDRVESDPALQVPYEQAHHKRSFFKVIQEYTRRSGKSTEVQNEREIMWQKWYMQGKMPDNSGSFHGHQRTLNVQPFREPS